MPRRLPGLRAVGFDLDGTLVDTAPDLAAAMNGVLAALGARTLPYERIRAMIGGGIEHLVARALRASLGAEMAAEALQADALARFRVTYGARLYEDSRLYPGVLETLRSLAAEGLALGCVTNKHSAFSVPLLRAVGLEGVLGFTLCADRFEDRKPQPNLLLAACRLLGVPPRAMLYVGDSQRDVQAAHAAGCRSALVTYGYGRSEEPAGPAADILVDRLEELDGLGSGPEVP